MITEERYAEKIRALLAKAESTTPEEAEQCVAKAQELMTKYAINQALLDQAAGRTVDEIEQRKVQLVGLFHEVKMHITCGVARYNGCRPVYHRHDSSYTPLVVDGKSYRHGTVLTLTGFRSDLERVLMLDASLQLQCSRALQTWYRANRQTWWTKGMDHGERRQFIRGFYQAIVQRLHEANERGRTEAAREEATRSNVTQAEATKCVALVLRSREDRVDDWFDKKYGKTLRNVSQNYRPGSRTAGEAGRVAGSRADLGQPRVGGQKGLPS